MNRRFVYEELPSIGWYMIWLNIKALILRKPVVSSYVEVPKHLPCGCENPAYGKATHEETIITCIDCFDLIPARLSKRQSEHSD